MSIRPYFIALEPAAPLLEHVWRAKRRVWLLAGDQQFLADPPHCTVYLALFAEPRRVQAAMEKLADEFPQQPVQVTNWHTFTADPLTGYHTLVMDLNPEHAAELRKFQDRVIDELATLRDPAATKDRYQRRWRSLSGVQQQAVSRLGFPYVGEAWHPHLTVGSIAPAEWPQVAAELLHESPACTCSWQTLRLYELRHETPHMYASFPLPQGVATA